MTRSSPKRKAAPPAKRGVSRTFIVLTVIMVVVFIVGLAAVLLLVQNG